MDMEVKKETLVIKKKRKANGLTKSIPKLKDIKNSASSSMFLSTMEMSLSMCAPTSDEDDTDSDFENEYIDPLWVVDEGLMEDRKKILASENKRAKKNSANSPTKRAQIVTRKRGSSAPVPKDFTVGTLSSILPPSSLHAAREQQEQQDPKEPQEEKEPIEPTEQKEPTNERKTKEEEKEPVKEQDKEEGKDHNNNNNNKEVDRAQTTEVRRLQISGISSSPPDVNTPTSPGSAKKKADDTDEESKKQASDKKGKKKKEKHKSASASLTMSMIRSSPKKGLFSRFGGYDDNNLNSGRRSGILPSSLSTGDLTGKQQLMRSPKSSEELSLASPTRGISTAPIPKEGGTESKRKRSIPKRLSLGEHYAMARDDQIQNGVDGCTTPLPSLKALKLLGVKDYDDLFHLDGARLEALKAEQRRQEGSSQSHRGYLSPRHYSLRHLQLSPRSPSTRSSNRDFNFPSKKKHTPNNNNNNNNSNSNSNNELNQSMFDSTGSDSSIYTRTPKSPSSIQDIPKFASMGSVSSLLSGMTPHTPESLSKLSNEEKDKTILAMQAQMQEMQSKMKKTEAKLLRKSRKLRKARREAKRLAGKDPLSKSSDPMPLLSLSAPTPPVSPSSHEKANITTTNNNNTTTTNDEST